MRLLDKVILGYLVIVSVVAAARIPENPACWWLLGAHLLAALLVFLVQNPRLGPMGRTVREVYPIMLLLLFYGELDVLNGVNIQTHDPAIQRLEAAIFGEQVSRTLWVRYPSVVASTVLHAMYWSYYLLLLAPVVYFAVRQDWLSLRRTVFVVIATLLACYLVFIAYPVAGPYYEFARPAPWFLDNAPARLVYATLATGSSFGAAFPSSHVAATIAATSGAWRGDRRLGRVMLPVAALLTLSVVYCQLHYGIDAITGVVVGGAAWWLGGKYRE